MEVHIYKAECGDAFRLTFLGEDNKRHHIFIDSGYERTFRDFIGNDVERINSAKEEIDLWIISHIHDDHIGGVINYVNAIQKKLRKDLVKEWWHNPPRISKVPIPVNTTSVGASIGQGNDLTDYLMSISKIPAADILNTLNPRKIDRMTLTILSPGKSQLTDLRKKYALPGTAIERNEDSATDTAAYVKPRDYKTLADSFDLNDWVEDDNKDNGSSIAVMLEIGKHCSLWLADAFPSVVADKLSSMGYNAKDQLHCALVKVAHHGCDNNNGDRLYDMIDCQHYIISADGKNKHALPNKKALIRILENKNRNKSLTYHFYFTHDDPVLRSIFDVEGPRIFEILNFRMHFGTSGFNLQ